MTAAAVGTALGEAAQIDGFLGIALMDARSGLCLGTAGGAGLDIRAAATGSVEAVRAELRGLPVEDVLVTLGGHCHLLRILKRDGLFLHLALTRSGANLATARHALSRLAGKLA